MLLRSAFNALTRLHSRPGTLKRLGDPDIFSACRLTPSNYFRFGNGPEYSTVKGVEFILPKDSLTGQFAQKLSFSAIPDTGSFKIQYGIQATTALAYDDTASDIQTALRLLTNLEDVVVTGSFLLGFTITFVGFSSAPAVGIVIDNTLEESSEAVETSWAHTTTPWAESVKKGDRILDGSKLWTVDEIMEMHDLGASVIGYRVRCD
jgi:hypothetical protein